MISLKFKRSESFYIREGWIEKAINAINENAEKNIFYKNNGIEVLGIGANMVKGLKHWLQSSKIIDAKSQLSEFGKLLLKYDRYLETDFSWFLIHYFISCDLENNPVFNAMFNSFRLRSFNKEEAVAVAFDYLLSFQPVELRADIDKRKKYIEDDFTVFTRSYYSDAQENDCPEDNYICPMVGLKLLTKKNNRFFMTRPQYSKLSYLIVYYTLQETFGEKTEYKNKFTIDDALKEKNSPFFLFNLDKNIFLQYLDEIQRKGFIHIDRTAGLNTAYISKTIELEEIFKLRFGSDSNV